MYVLKGALAQNRVDVDIDTDHFFPWTGSIFSRSSSCLLPLISCRPHSHPSSYCTHPSPILIGPSLSCHLLSLVASLLHILPPVVTPKFSLLSSCRNHSTCIVLLSIRNPDYFLHHARQSAVVLLVHRYTHDRCLSLASRVFHITGGAGASCVTARPSPRPARAAGRHRCNTGGLDNHTALVSHERRTDEAIGGRTLGVRVLPGFLFII